MGALKLSQKLKKIRDPMMSWGPTWQRCHSPTTDYRDNQLNKFPISFLGHSFLMYISQSFIDLKFHNGYIGVIIQVLAKMYHMYYVRQYKHAFSR